MLDTNVISEFSRSGKPDESVAKWLKGMAEKNLFASVQQRPDSGAIAMIGERHTNVIHDLHNRLSNYDCRLVVAASYMHIATHWIVAGALFMIGLGIAGGVAKTRQKDV